MSDDHTHEEPNGKADLTDEEQVAMLENTDNSPDPEVDQPESASDIDPADMEESI